MAIEIIVLPSAQADIWSIIERFIDVAGPGVAERFESALEACFQRLAEYPRMGAVRERPNPELRSLRFVVLSEFPNIVVYYRETPVTLDIVRVVDGRRQISDDKFNG
ncbi:hypothetical protein PHYC_03093 [Phycisphaerales bacterium]|nr:hypothetical protein PHYC_03093 [Phycisphaerales bacterium]